MNRLTSRLVLLCAALCAATSVCAMPVPDLSGMKLSADFLYWRPGGLDTQVVSPAVSGGSSVLGPTDGLQYGFKPGFKLTDDMGAWRLSWTRLTGSTQFSASCPAGQTCLNALLAPPPVAAFSQANSAAAGSELRLDIVDADYRAPLLEADEGKRTMTWAMGARWLRLRSDETALYTSLSASEEYDRHAVSNLIGLHSAMEGRYRFRQGWSLDGCAGLSLLTGRAHVDQDMNNIGGTNSQQGTAQNVTVPVLELDAKVSYSPFDMLSVWLGYDFMQLANASLQQQYPSAGGMILTQTTQNVSFQGPRLGASWKF